MFAAHSHLIFFFFLVFFAEIIAGAGISPSLLVLPLITLTVQKVISTFDNLTFGLVFFFCERLMEIHLDLLQGCNQASLPVIPSFTSTDTASPLPSLRSGRVSFQSWKKKKNERVAPSLCSLTPLRPRGFP